MLRRHFVATAAIAGLTLGASAAEAQLLRRPTAPVTVNKSSDTVKQSSKASTLTVPAGRWGTTEPYERPCYARAITEPCSTPGPSVKIEFPGFRVRK